jgi:hypothetical protein
MCITQSEIKGSDQLLFVFLEKPLYEIYLISYMNQGTSRREEEHVDGFKEKSNQINKLN